MFAVVIFLVFLLLSAGLSLAGWILFSVGLYNDAKGNYNQDPLLWSLLTLFLGWIPAVIYFCNRTNNFLKIVCPNCHNLLPKPEQVCPFCRNSLSLPPEDPAFIALRKKGKTQMIRGVVLYGIGMILLIIFYILFFIFSFRAAGWN